MKSLRFFLLDLGEETTSQGSEIWLWGIGDDGKNVLLVDRSFRPYLYVIPKEGSAPETVFDALRSSGNSYANVLESSIEEKKLFGQIVKAVKVTSTSTETLEAIAKHLRKLGQVQQIIGHDIRYSSLYLYDRGLIPCRWHETEAEELRISHVIYWQCLPLTRFPTPDRPQK